MRDHNDDGDVLASLFYTEEPRLWRAAWTAFIRRYGDLVVSSVVAVLRHWGALDPSSLEDALAEAWLALIEDDMRRLRLFDGHHGRLCSYITTIASRLTTDSMRRKKTAAADLLDEHDGATVERDHDTNDPHRGDLIQRAIERLSERERDFILSVFYEEQSAEQLAADLGITVVTVYTRKYKLTKKLARLVDEMQ